MMANLTPEEAKAKLRAHLAGMDADEKDAHG